MPKKMNKAKRPKKTTKSTPLIRSDWRRLVNEPFFAKRYLWCSLAVLLATTLLWAILSANLQRANADQVVNAFMFEHVRTLQGAVMPGQHSFLLKWPAFLLIHLGGYSLRAFSVVTVGLVLVTIGGLVTLLGSIERRPIVLGTLCLALASVLLLVPPMPYAGGILPVNMAMMTTRNLEYIVFIASLVLLLKSRRILSWQFGAALLLMALLIASDKLFLTLALGGSLAALLAYALVQGWNLASLSARWVINSLLAAVAALGILSLLDQLHITHVLAGDSNGPYALIHNGRQLGLGALYAVLGLLTNFGANPAYDATRIRDLHHLAVERLLSFGGVAYLLNLAIAVFAGWAAWRLLKNSFRRHRQRDLPLHEATKLAILLLWSAAVAVAAFVATNHYYAVDARYLTITIFAAFVGLAAYSAQRQWSAQRVVAAGLIIGIGIIAGITANLATYRTQSAALATINDRNDLIRQVLSQHPVDVLVGDYWRVLPTKLQQPNLTVMPMENCTAARNALTSSQWQPDLTKHRFAYLLTFDQGLTGYPACSLEEITAAFGRPNSSALIAGSFDHPREQLLFYDQGAHRSAPQKRPSTVLPITADELPNTACSAPTTMNIVAHQDDDLLFMNPDINHDIAAGHCVRTIYLTAGDAGNGQFYWLGREHGSEAAYNIMDGASQDVWIERVVKLSDTAFVTIANPRANPKITLIFMHLPDGNPDGNGFRASHFESLKKLDEQAVPTIHSVDGQSAYTATQLADTLANLMALYQPSSIRTQANYVGQQFRDHSDHMMVGRFVKKAYARYESEHFENHVTIPLSFYIGYPIHEFGENVSGDDLKQKESVFFAYGHFDSGVCRSMAQCNDHSVYGIYLPRQYQNVE